MFSSYAHRLSGGLRQRAVIAMALSCEPSLIIADEPTTALDPTVQLQIIELFEKINKETGTAILLITHDFGVVARLAQKVAVMYAGQIVEQGSLEELLQSPAHPYTRSLLACIPSTQWIFFQVKKNKSWFKLRGRLLPWRICRQGAILPIGVRKSKPFAGKKSPKW